MPGMVGNLGEAAMIEPIGIDVYSDVVCPWCYIGKRRLEQALVALGEKHEAVRPNWRAFQLNPDLPAEGVARKQYVETKFGGAERAKEIYARVAKVGNEVGIPFQFEKIERQPNTINAHRVIRYAGNHDRQDAVVEALFRAFFLELQDIGSIAALSDIACSAGLNRDLVFTYLSSDEGVVGVREEYETARRIGITGVPYFVFGGRYALSGAQGSDVLLQTYQQAARVLATKGLGS